MTIYRVSMTAYNSPMGTSIADNVDARLPGTFSAPRTGYPTSGHRIPPQHVRMARRQELIDADTGPGVARDAEASLLGAVEAHVYRKDRAHGIAVGLACRGADDFSGYLSTGEDEFTRLRGPQDVLRHVFGVSS